MNGPPVALRLYGLNHVAGKTVTIFAGGLDLGDYLISAAGTVDIPIGAANGLFTAEFATRPFVVGYVYTSQGQLLRGLAPQEVGAVNGPALGKTRRTHMFAALLQNAAGLSFGTDFTNMRAMQPMSAGSYAYVAGQLYSGVYQDTLDDTYSFDSQLGWQITRPYPATVVAVEQFLQTQDR